MTPLTDIIEALRALKPVLRERYGVCAMTVFGSRARNQGSENSDLDLLVDFEPGARPTLFSLARMDALLEDSLGLKVDTVPRESLNPRYRELIQSDLVQV
ncbi:MAG: nucleotidyltransferase family protein [Caulobacterales bacterium]